MDDDRPRNAAADGAHNVLGNEGIAPRELLAIGRRELEAYGGRVVAGRVVDARPVDGGFEVALADGGVLTARRLLLAGGGTDELPDVPGLAARWGRDVLHCPYCHGYEVRGQAIGVLATSAVSVHSALMFSQLSQDVVLFAHGYSPTAEERATLTARGVQVVEGQVSGVEVTDDRLSGVRLASGGVVAREALVVTSFVRARTDHLAGLDLPVEELRMGDLVLGTKIVAEPTGRTRCRGVGGGQRGRADGPGGRLDGRGADGRGAAEHGPDHRGRRPGRPLSGPVSRRGCRRRPRRRGRRR